MMVLLQTIYEVATVQTFVFSATLFGKQQKSSKFGSADQDKKKILLKKLKLKKTPVTIDLTNEDQSKEESESVTIPSGLKLPETLKLSQIQSNDDQDAEAILAHVLYRRFIETVDQDHYRVIIFCNAISYIYRLEPLLGTLLADPRMINDQMRMIDNKS